MLAASERTSQVNGSVAQLDQMTQQNAELVGRRGREPEETGHPARAGGRHVPTRDNCVQVVLNLTLDAPISR
jgi:hypothetical protein